MSGGRNHNAAELLCCTTAYRGTGLPNQGAAKQRAEVSEYDEVDEDDVVDEDNVIYKDNEVEEDDVVDEDNEVEEDDKDDEDENQTDDPVHRKGKKAALTMDDSDVYLEPEKAVETTIKDNAGHVVEAGAEEWREAGRQGQHKSGKKGGGGDTSEDDNRGLEVEEKEAGKAGTKDGGRKVEVEARKTEKVGGGGQAAGETSADGKMYEVEEEVDAKVEEEDDASEAKGWKAPTEDASKGSLKAKKRSGQAKQREGGRKARASHRFFKADTGLRVENQLSPEPRADEEEAVGQMGPSGEGAREAGEDIGGQEASRETELQGGAEEAIHTGKQPAAVV
jgi:hypothetical protein